ncbi:MAG TPA: hypothetical protein VHS99_23720 [Chloroflexota bacterium]|nr:hypothetical protein [Chloroflexota bacterium]
MTGSPHGPAGSAPQRPAAVHHVATLPMRRLQAGAGIAMAAVAPMTGCHPAGVQGQRGKGGLFG